MNEHVISLISAVGTFTLILQILILYNITLLTIIFNYLMYEHILRFCRITKNNLTVIILIKHFVLYLYNLI